MTAHQPPKNPHPSSELWNYRRKWFSWATGQALGNLIGVTSGHARILELELEAVFCTGAWYATIVFAYAAAEVYLVGQGQNKNKGAKFLNDFGLREEWIWIINRRKYIIHSNQHSPKNAHEMLYEQPELEEDAKRAVQFALNVLLLGTRKQLPSSIEKDS